MNPVHKAMHDIAQGVINISEGADRVTTDAAGNGTIANLSPKRECKTPDDYAQNRTADGAFIAQLSPIHKAMVAICELLPPPDGDVNLILRDARISHRPSGKHGSADWLVVHPTSDAILAICKTEKDAQAVVTCLNTIAAHLRAP